MLNRNAGERLMYYDKMTKKEVISEHRAAMLEVKELQAKIDVLMLEYCPEKLAKHQVPVSLLREQGL